MKVAATEEALALRRENLLARSALQRREIRAASTSLLPVLDKVEHGLRIGAWARDHAGLLGAGAGALMLLMKLRRPRAAKVAVGAGVRVGAGLGVVGIVRLALRGWSIWRTVQRLRGPQTGRPV